MLDEWKLSLSKNLRALREARNFSIEALAEASGVGNATIADIENGRVGSTGPGCATLIRLAVALQSSPDVLLGFGSPAIGGEALIDTEAIEAIENASSLEDLEALRRPSGWRYGLQVTDRFKWATLSELSEVEQRCNARIAELYLEKKRRGKG